jgi:hypothetical protein
MTDDVRFAAVFFGSAFAHVLVRLAWGAVVPRVVGEAKWVRTRRIRRDRDRGPARVSPLPLPTSLTVFSRARPPNPGRAL